MEEKRIKRARAYHSNALDAFLSLSEPEELARNQTRMVLAAKIYEAMKAKNIGKKQLAEMMGQSPSVITKWLSGGHNFTVDTLTDIQRVLEIQLLAVDEKPPMQNIYQITIQVALPQPYEILHSTGQSFRLPSTRTDKMRTLKDSEVSKRAIAYA